MQAIKYKWLSTTEGLEPFIFLKNGSQIEKMRLMNQDLAFSVGKKRCIGYFKNGRHVPCPENRTVESGNNCNECRINDDFFLCIKCNGEKCINEKQQKSCNQTSYFVYLAAFDSILKVGISFEGRVLERLIEQGADFGAKIAFVKSGENVRKIEQGVRKHLGIVDFVTGDQKQKLIFGDPNKSIPNIYKAIAQLRTNGVSQYMINPEIYDLREHYRLHQVIGKPARMKLKDDSMIEGTIVAAKGNIIIARTKTGFMSFNSHELIGRDIMLNN